MPKAAKKTTELCGDCELCFIQLGPKHDWRTGNTRRTATGCCMAVYAKRASLLHECVTMSDMVNPFNPCANPEERKAFIAEMRRKHLPLEEMLRMDRAPREITEVTL